MALMKGFSQLALRPALSGRFAIYQYSFSMVCRDLVCNILCDGITIPCSGNKIGYILKYLFQNKNILPKKRSAPVGAHLFISFAYSDSSSSSRFLLFRYSIPALETKVMAA